MNRNDYFNIIIAGVIRGGIIVFMGFGMMNIFWINNKDNIDLLGLYDYRAATIGDGIFLPIFIAAMSIYLYKNNILNRKQRYYSYIVGGIFAFVGLLIQLSWILNDDIGLNWTIPRPRHFTIAGWYHAFFFIAMFYYISMLISRVWLTRRWLNKRYPTCFDEICFCIMWLAGSGFLFMFALDDYSYKYAYISLLLVVYALIIFIIIVFCFTSIGKIKYYDWICLLSGVTTSLGIALMINGDFSPNVLFFVANIFLSFVFIVPQKRMNKMLMFIILTMFPVLSLNLASATTGTNGYILVLDVIVPCFIALGQAKDEKCGIAYDVCIQHITCGGILSLLVIITSTIFLFDNLEKFTSLINIFMDVIIVKVGFSMIENIFSYVVSAEHEYDIADINERLMKEMHLKISKFWSYFFIVLISVGMLLYFVLTLGSFIEIVSIKYLLVLPVWNKENSVLLILMMIIICILFFFRNLRTPKTSKGLVILYLFLLLIAYVLLFANIYLLRSPYAIEMKIRDLTSLFAIFMISGSSLMIMENFYSNIILIRGVEGNIITKLSVFIIGIGNFFVIMCSIFPPVDKNGSRSSSLVFLLVSLIGIIISVLILPVLVGKVVQNEMKGVQIATTKPLGGILQNGFLISVLIFLGGVVPVYFCSLGKSDIDVFIGILLIICNIYWPLSYCLKNNVQHLKNQIDFYYKLKNKKNSDNSVLYKQIYGLGKHLRRQNILTFVAFLIYCLIPIAIEIFGCLMFRRSIKKEFIDKYIPNIFR